MLSNATQVVGFLCSLFSDSLCGLYEKRQLKKQQGLSLKRKQITRKFVIIAKGFFLIARRIFLIAPKLVVSTRLDLTLTRLDLTLARLDFVSARLDSPLLRRYFRFGYCFRFRYILTFLTMVLPSVVVMRSSSTRVAPGARLKVDWSVRSSVLPRVSVTTMSATGPLTLTVDR